MSVQNPEYSKISIHCHFGGRDADCTLDRSIKEILQFDLAEAISQIDEAVDNGFRLLAQTNSNCIDAASWLLLRRYAIWKGVELLPGAEVNLRNWEQKDRVLHVVIVFSPDSNVYSLQQKMRDIYEGNDDYSLEMDQLAGLLHGNRAIVCVHGIKQDERSVRGNAEMAHDVIGVNHFFPVAIEDNRSFHTQILAEELKGFLSTSQVEWVEETAASISAVDRMSFAAIPSPAYLWSGNTFDDLYYCVLTGSARIVREEHIVERPLYISRIVIEGSDHLGESEIVCSQGLNCIIGSSGSGKTLLLDMLMNKMKGHHLTEMTSSRGNYEDLYSPSQIHLYGPNGVELGLADGFEVIEGENLYQKVLSAYTGSPSELMSELGLNVNTKKYTSMLEEFQRGLRAYLEERQSAKKAKEDAANALAQAQSAARFIDANNADRGDAISYTVDSDNSARIKSFEKSRKACLEDDIEAKRALDTLHAIAERNELSESVVNSIRALKDAISKEMQTKVSKYDGLLEDARYVQKKQLFIYGACQTYNGIVSRQSQQANEKKQVLADKLKELGEDLLDSRRHLFQAIVPMLDEKTVMDSVILEGDTEISRLRVKQVNLTLDEGELLSAFRQNISKRASSGRVKIGLFKPPYALSNSEDVKAMLDVFADGNLSTDLTLLLPPDQAIEYEIELKDENGNFRPVNEFSAGMFSKIYVTHFLDAAISDAGSNTVVLYDQPESNMEKAFLSATLADKFFELRKNHQIFVATHEPLLVVNTDANEIILASNEKRVGQTNHVSYTNRSFVGAHGKAELVEEVARLIDGGTRAVTHRSNVYEGMGNR